MISLSVTDSHFNDFIVCDWFTFYWFHCLSLIHISVISLSVTVSHFNVSHVTDSHFNDFIVCHWFTCQRLSVTVSHFNVSHLFTFQHWSVTDSHFLHLAFLYTTTPIKVLDSSKFLSMCDVLFIPTLSLNTSPILSNGPHSSHSYREATLQKYSHLACVSVCLSICLCVSV